MAAYNKYKMMPYQVYGNACVDQLAKLGAALAPATHRPVKWVDGLAWQVQTRIVSAHILAASSKAEAGHSG